MDAALKDAVLQRPSIIGDTPEGILIGRNVVGTEEINIEQQRNMVQEWRRRHDRRGDSCTPGGTIGKQGDLLTFAATLSWMTASVIGGFE